MQSNYDEVRLKNETSKKIDPIVPYHVFVYNPYQFEDISMLLAYKHAYTQFNADQRFCTNFC